MKYYKALYDIRAVKDNGRTIRPEFIKDELYTEKELRHCCEHFGWNFDKLVKWNFYKVEISKSNVYWFFGCRFADNSDTLYIPSDEC